MEQITKRDGFYYYGEQRCDDASEAYSCFREDYHKSIGRDASRKLDKLGRRRERVHGFGFVFDKPVEKPGGHYGRTRCWFMGLVGLSYCRLTGIMDCPDLPEEEFYKWLDWAFSRGSGALMTLGIKAKTGRTSKRLKKRYR